MTDNTTTSGEIAQKTKWPEREAEATADQLIIHGARLAMFIDVRHDQAYRDVPWGDKENPEYRPAINRYVESIAWMIAQAQVTLALAEVQRHSPEQAEDLAKHLWLMTEDGGALHELMFDVLNDRGIDAQAVWAAAEAEASEEKSA